nr:MAG TPA: hypothetical protein [Caudoviricetes sp.]
MFLIKIVSVSLFQRPLYTLWYIGQRYDIDSERLLYQFV